MPKVILGQPVDEKKWAEAKRLAAEEGHSEDYAYIMGIYKRMSGLSKAFDPSGLVRVPVTAILDGKPYQTYRWKRPEAPKEWGYLLGDNGKPLTLYHGTANDFSKFDKTKIGSATDEGELGAGFYFSTDPQVAQSSPRIVEAKLKISNPLVITFPTWRSDKKKLITQKLHIAEQSSSLGITGVLKLAGHDAVILDYSPVGYNHKEIMVPDADQIEVESNSVRAEGVDGKGVDSPAFKAWFKDSKVVDENGKPLVVYHGTTAEFGKFKIGNKKTAMGAQNATGIFFTPSAQEANKFSGFDGAIIPTYLSIQNPFTTSYDEVVKKTFGSVKEAQKLRKELQSKGFDGMIIIHAGYDDLSNYIEKAPREYVAFSPTQIKSIYNRGTWDPGDPHIDKSLTFSGWKLQGRRKVHGMDISIENKKGSVRRGKDKDGHAWATKMHADYGYIRGTVGKDKDHLDCYVGPNPESTRVFIVHQNDPTTGRYDEDKIILGVDTPEEAKALYMKQYDRPGFFGSMDETDIETFKAKAFADSAKGKKLVIKAMKQRGSRFFTEEELRAKGAEGLGRMLTDAELRERHTRKRMEGLIERMNPDELAVGVKVEMEHTDDPAEARKIAFDHLIEDSRYYSKLLEAGLVDEPKAIEEAKKRGLEKSIRLDSPKDSQGPIKITVWALK